MNIPNDTLKKLKFDLKKRWEIKHPQPKSKPISNQNHVLNELIMKEIELTLKAKDEIDLLTLLYQRRLENAESINDYYLQQHNKKL